MKKLSKKEEKEIDKRVKKAVKFTKSAEGKRKIKEAFEQVRKDCEKYREDQRVNPEDLTKPLGCRLTNKLVGFFI